MLTPGRGHGEVQWEGDIPSPVTTYAASLQGTSMMSNLTAPPSRVTTNSAVVRRVPRRNGIRYFYSHGGLEMPVPMPRAGTASGNVQSSAFQRILVQLHDWTQNDAWYIAYPRNMGWSFRVPQLKTKVTGGPTDARMQPRPRFNRVQRVPRYTTTPTAYQTRSGKG